MVDVKISELPVAGSAAGTDQLEANQAGTSRSITVAQVGTALALTGYAPLASPVFTGDPQAPTPATADNDTSISTTAFVKAQGYQTAAQVTTSLGSYLALTGGTLSGPGTLTGTTATFSGAVGISGNTTFTGSSAGGGHVLYTDTNTGGQTWQTGPGSGSGSPDEWVVYNQGTAIRNLSLNKNGQVSLAGLLVGTTATFTGTVSAPGAQIQMVSTETGTVATGTTIIPADSTIPQITEGDQYMTLAITPKSATSKLIIEVTFVGTNLLTATFLTAALFQDATANALAAAVAMVTAANATQTISFRHIMTSGTTSATTFRVRAGPGAATTTTFNGINAVQLFGGVCASSIVIREVA